MRFRLFISFLLAAAVAFAQPNASNLPKGFIYIQQHIPDISYDLKYCGHHNFVGVPITGYERPRLILTEKATLALKKVEQELNKQGLGLKIFDAYRPQSAVNHFKSWASRPTDTLSKAEFYPDIDKSLLFKKGFIASRSGHSRGSTVDLTIIAMHNKEELDMGGPFDYFGEVSAHTYTKLTADARKNRQLLKNTMEKHGFRSYSKEWWHYTLNNEPFPNIYFDFPVR